MLGDKKTFYVDSERLLAEKLFKKRERSGQNTLFTCGELRQTADTNDTMWSEQTTEQDSTPAPILESAIIGGGEEHVIVKLLTTNNAASSTGSEVLTKLLAGSGAAVVGSTILFSNVQAQGLRKIEPKPANSEAEGEKLGEADGEANSSGR